MKALAQDIRKLLAARIQGASAADLFAIATSICAADERAQWTECCIKAEPAGRFRKLDLHGNSVESDCIAVYDTETKLTWTSKPLECGQVSWKDAMTAAANYRLFGKDDWRVPTIKEYVSILDHSRTAPAIDKTYFTTDGSWEWTSIVDAEAPSGYAWFVDLPFGYVLRLNQTDHYYVRAVRAGQSLELGL